jgi:hypothetical protein
MDSLPSGLATGLPHCTEAGSLPCALRKPPLRINQSKRHSTTFSMFRRFDARNAAQDALDLSPFCKMIVFDWPPKSVAVGASVPRIHLECELYE